MASELQCVNTTGTTVYFLLRSSTSTIYNGSGFEAYTTANLATYKIAATEQGSASGYFTANMPSVAADTYNVEAHQQAGGSPAESDLKVGVGELRWTGSAVLSQTGDAYGRIGAAGAGLTNIGDTRLARLDQSISTILTTALTESYAAPGAAPTVSQALFLLQQMLAGNFAISGTTVTVYKLNGSTAAATFTLNSATSPTSLTRAT